MPEAPDLTLSQGFIASQILFHLDENRWEWKGYRGGFAYIKRECEPFIRLMPWKLVEVEDLSSPSAIAVARAETAYN